MDKLPIAGSPEANAIAEKKALDVAENGPRLMYGQGIWLAAKCPTGKHELHGGLGAMGVGQMWCPANPAHRGTPEWDALPVERCCNFGIRDACKETD